MSRFLVATSANGSTAKKTNLMVGTPDAPLRESATDSTIILPTRLQHETNGSMISDH